MPWRLGYLLLEEVWFRVEVVALEGLVKFCVVLQIPLICVKTLASGVGDRSKSGVGLYKYWCEKRGNTVNAGLKECEQLRAVQEGG